MPKKLRLKLTINVSTLSVGFTLWFQSLSKLKKYSGTRPNSYGYAKRVRKLHNMDEYLVGVPLGNHTWTFEYPYT